MTRRGFRKEDPISYRAENDAALEAEPPAIRWVRNSKGVLVAVEVEDPHVDKPNRKQMKPRKKTA